MRKYQLGGSAKDELNQFAQEIILNQLFGENTESKLLQLAKEQPQIIQQLFLIWKQAGIEGVVKALQQALKAAKGAKLNRVMALSNRCPEGYMKKGGKCKKCEKGEKFSDPSKGVFHVHSYFQNGGVQKKQPGGVVKGLYDIRDDFSAGELIPGGIDVYPKYLRIITDLTPWSGTIGYIENTPNGFKTLGGFDSLNGNHLYWLPNERERSRSEQYYGTSAGTKKANESGKKAYKLAEKKYKRNKGKTVVTKSKK